MLMHFSGLGFTFWCHKECSLFPQTGEVYLVAGGGRMLAVLVVILR